MNIWMFKNKFPLVESIQDKPTGFNLAIVLLERLLSDIKIVASEIVHFCI